MWKDLLMLSTLVATVPESHSALMVAVVCTQQTELLSRLGKQCVAVARGKQSHQIAMCCVRYDLQILGRLACSYTRGDRPAVTVIR